MQKSNLVPFQKWLDERGAHAVTGWRWRKRGWIKTVSIGGKVYITEEEIQNFYARAQAGEFKRAGA